MSDLSTLVRKLAEGSVPERREAAGALARLQDGNATAPLVSALRDSAVRWHAREALLALGADRVTSPLVGLLGSPQEALRALAAETLGLVRARAALAPLAAALDEGDPALRRAAAEALGKLGDREAVNPLLRHAGDPDPDVQNAVLWALSEIADPEGLNLLVERARAGPLESRLVAVAGLRRFPDARARKALQDGLGDPHVRVRLYSAESLLSRAEPEGRAVVLALFRNPDHETRWLAASALRGVPQPARPQVAAQAGPLLLDLVAEASGDDRYLPLMTLRHLRVDLPDSLAPRLREVLAPVAAETDSRISRLAAEVLRTLAAPPPSANS